MSSATEFDTHNKILGFYYLLNELSCKHREECMKALTTNNHSRSVQEYARYFTYKRFSDHFYTAFLKAKQEEPKKPFIHDEFCKSSQTKDIQFKGEVERWLNSHICIMDENIQKGGLQYMIEDGVRVAILNGPDANVIGKQLSDIYHAFNHMGVMIEGENLNAILHKTVADIKSIWYAGLLDWRRSDVTSNSHLVRTYFGLRAPKLTG